MKLSKENQERLEIKLDILEKGDDIFLDEIKKLEKSFFSKVLSIIRGFSTKGGKLVNDDTNNQLLLKLRGRLREALADSTLESKTRQFLTNFDKVKDLNRDLLVDINKVSYSKIESLVNTTQREYVEELTRGLLSQDAQDVGMIKPVQKIMFRQITTGISVSEAENELRRFIKTDEDGLGHLSRYVRTYAMESINRFNGEINHQAAVEFDLDGFSFVGSLIANSHVNCRQMINGTGSLGDYMITDGINEGLYRISDLPKMISIMKSRLSWGKKTTPLVNTNNYFVYRNHWGCRHEILPVRLLDEDTN